MGLEIYSNGTRYWFNSKNEYHRENGPAIEFSDGEKEWRKNGLLHRLDGPAILLRTGHKGWYKNGKRHREDGPALECSDGRKLWYLEDIRYSEEEYNKTQKEKIK